MFVYIRGGEGAKQRLTLYKVIVIVETLRVFVSLCSVKYPCFRAAPYQGAQNVFRSSFFVLRP